MIDLSQDLLQILTKSADESGRPFVIKWLNQCIDLLTRAKVLEAEYSKLKTIQVTVNNAIMQNYQEIKTDLKTDKLIKEMYIFLNEVGETLRGESLIYQVTLSTGKGQSKNMTTFELPLEKFLELTTATHTRLTLSRTKTILNRIAKDNDVNQRKWTEEEIFNYQRFIYNAKRVQQGRWKKVNRGNLLEAYSRYEDLRNSGMSKGSTTIAMQETLRGTQGFWQGADYNGFQIKGNAASVANIYTCINQLNELYLILSGLQFNNITEFNDRVSQINQQTQIELTKYADLTVDELLAKLAKQFGVQ